MKVTFRSSAELEAHQSVRVVGNLAQLGSWEPTAAPSCRATFNDNQDLIAEIEIDDSVVDVVEYKYVLCEVRDTGGRLRWERGSNRVIHVLTQSEITVDDVPFQDGAGKWMPCETLEIADSCESIEPSTNVLSPSGGAVGEREQEKVKKEQVAGDGDYCAAKIVAEENNKGGAAPGDAAPEKKIVRVFSLPFFNPMTEEERVAFRDERAAAEGREPGMFHVFDGIGRLFTKPVVVHRT